MANFPSECVVSENDRVESEENLHLQELREHAADYETDVPNCDGDENNNMYIDQDSACNLEQRDTTPTHTTVKFKEQTQQNDNKTRQNAPATGFDNAVNFDSSSKESGKKRREKNFVQPSEGIVVYLQMDNGVRMEYHEVPQKYYSSELCWLIVKDTGIKYDGFKLLSNGEQLKPMVPLEELADISGIVKLDLNLYDREKDSGKIYLGERFLTSKSGLNVKVVVRKTFIGMGPCGAENVLRVTVDQAGKPIKKEVHVQWLPKDHHKLFLGGYRHTISKKRYLHAYSQTRGLPRPNSEVQVFSRDTQTYRMKHFGQATVNHMSTQFSKPGFFVSNYQDQLRTPGVYETADEYLARILKQIIVIQKYTRRWLAKRYVDRLRKIRNAFEQWKREHENTLKRDREKRVNEDLERRLHPKCRADFDRLFNALEQWRRSELAKIDRQQLSTAERKAALALLLDDETELISAIGRHQLCASKKGRETAQVNLLRKAAAPVRWISSINGRPLEIETPQTLRAKELLDIYISLSMECLTKEERLDILLTAKRITGVYQLKICKEIVSLIDREAELMMRGVREDQLRGLRRRILSRFVKFSEIPQVNPEIAKYLSVPSGDREKIADALKGNVQYCLSCDRYLKTSEFPLSARVNRLAPCMSCRRQDNRARKRSDLAPYQHILVELRRNETELVQNARKQAHEEAKEAEIQRLERGETPHPESIMELDGTDPNVLNTNPYPFLVNKEDIQFLIDEVWERRSVLSGWLDITDLVLTRWRISEPWSPWNTILLTREEAEAHVKLGNFSLELAYADALLNTVNQRLVMGQNAFRRLRNNGIRMACEQVITAQRMKNPENTAEWLRERRQELPPLVPHQQLETDDEARHKATYQPPTFQLPAIRGEKAWIDVNKEIQSA
ncbi:IQ and ubiquitin domain-containing protein [Fasciola gigantica]|uniref:IQ and ubiquitin domain-containing protein n=1 Tax=Fasciola gigantica TaxID=46835 RepID=A0A504YHF6_FASGI|nr:IQ and ubiquitin domain-containing protein [Fasciola gigantica]